MVTREGAVQKLRRVRCSSEEAVIRSGLERCRCGEAAANGGTQRIAGGAGGPALGHGDEQHRSHMRAVGVRRVAWGSRAAGSLAVRVGCQLGRQREQHGGPAAWEVSRKSLGPKQRAAASTSSWQRRGMPWWGCRLRLPMCWTATSLWRASGRWG